MLPWFAIFATRARISRLFSLSSWPPMITNVPAPIVCDVVAGEVGDVSISAGPGLFVPMELHPPVAAVQKLFVSRQAAVRKQPVSRSEDIRDRVIRCSEENDIGIHPRLQASFGVQLQYARRVGCD